MYFSLSQIFFGLKLFVLMFVLSYFTHFKELPSPILNFLDFCNCLQFSEAKLLQIITSVWSISEWYLFTSCRKKSQIKCQIKVKCEFWNHHTSKMGDFRLNPLTFFKENCKTYRNLAKPVTPVTFSLSVKSISNTLDKFNNIYYCFLLSGAVIQSHPGK